MAIPRPRTALCPNTVSLACPSHFLQDVSVYSPSPEGSYPGSFYYRHTSLSRCVAQMARITNRMMNKAPITNNPPMITMRSIWLGSAPIVTMFETSTTTDCSTAGGQAGPHPMVHPLPSATPAAVGVPLGVAEETIGVVAVGDCSRNGSVEVLVGVRIILMSVAVAVAAGFPCSSVAVGVADVSTVGVNDGGSTVGLAVSDGVAVGSTTVSDGTEVPVLDGVPVNSTNVAVLVAFGASVRQCGFPSCPSCSHSFPGTSSHEDP